MPRLSERLTGKSVEWIGRSVADNVSQDGDAALLIIIAAISARPRLISGTTARSAFNSRLVIGH